MLVRRRDQIPLSEPLRLGRLPCADQLRRGHPSKADKIVYRERNKRLRAQGNARPTEPKGRITYAQTILIHWVRQRRLTR
jgi:hypothetical protein